MSQKSSEGWTRRKVLRALGGGILSVAGWAAAKAEVLGHARREIGEDGGIWELCMDGSRIRPCAAA